MAIHPIANRQSFLFTEVCSKVYELAEVITQIAIRSAFIFSHILMTAACFPLSWHWLVIPISALGSTTLAAFFFPQNRILPPRELHNINPLVRPFNAALMPPHFPENSAVAYRNTSGNDCAFNASLHFFDSDPQIAAWMRNPVNDNTDLPAFIEFLRQYNPEEALIDHFQQFVNLQVLPRPSIRQLFRTFLEGYEGDVGMIEEQFNNTQIIHEVLADFFEANDHAKQSRLLISEGDSNRVRQALHQINPLISAANEQTDAPEIINTILDLLPNPMKMKIEETRVINTQGLPEPAPTPPRSDITNLVNLEIPRESLGTDLNALFSHFYESNDHDDVLLRRRNINGIETPYPVIGTITQFTEAPQALRICIKRRRNELPSQGWWNQGIEYMRRRYPRLGRILPRPMVFDTVKVDTSVECPDVMTIALKNGEHKRYRLASFVTHLGGVNSGHYIAGEIRDGQKFIENDSIVTLVQSQAEEAIWQKHLRKSYLLCYLPVEEDPAPVD